MTLLWLDAIAARTMIVIWLRDRSKDCAPDVAAALVKAADDIEAGEPFMEPL